MPWPVQVPPRAAPSTRGALEAVSKEPVGCGPSVTSSTATSRLPPASLVLFPSVRGRGLSLPDDLGQDVGVGDHDDEEGHHVDGHQENTAVDPLQVFRPQSQDGGGGRTRRRSPVEVVVLVRDQCIIDKEVFLSDVTNEGTCCSSTVAQDLTAVKLLLLSRRDPHKLTEEPHGGALVELDLWVLEHSEDERLRQREDPSRQPGQHYHDAAATAGHVHLYNCK